MGKDSLNEKLRKNPFLLGLGIIVLAIVVIAMFTLISAINKKTAEIEAQTTAAPETEAYDIQLPTEPATEKVGPAVLAGLKLYDANINSTDSQADKERATLTVGFKDKNTMLDALYASSVTKIDIRPVFVFYLADGTALECPGQFKLLESISGVKFFLNDIDDLKNAYAISDGKTVDFENVFAQKFNLYIEYKEGDGVGKTLLGTANDTEEVRKGAFAKPDAASQLASGIKKVKISGNGKVVWVDIYFDGSANYSGLNYAFKNNFIGFRYDNGGKEYDSLLSITRFDSECMIRCKFDSYSIDPIIKETGDMSLTVESLFAQKLTFFASDYDHANDLFVLN